MVRSRVSKKAAKIVLGISTIILIFSIAMTISFQMIYNSELKKEVTLSNGSLVTKIWEDIPLPIYEKLYFFNVTNPDEFMNGKATLNVSEVGPYTYRSKWVKINPQWNSNNTVSYREERIYHFVPELSNGTENDSIYTLNGPLIVAASIIKDKWKIPFDMYRMYEGEEVITMKTIRELAYEGYEDPLIKNDWVIDEGLPYKDGIFSWLYGKNASDDGLFTVFTGTDDESKTNLINMWNGEDRLNFWKGDTCNMLNGTSIETGPPIKDHVDSYTFFQSIFCRSLTFDYTEDVKHFDVTAKRFRPTRDLFANSTENPENHCFEVNREHASGVLDISPCQFRAPVFISFPHFYMGDSSYFIPVNGLDPDDEKHGSYIDVEPTTGLSIDLKVRFQINLEIHKVSSLTFTEEITNGVFPIFWVELGLEIDENLANFLKHSVRTPKIIAYSVIGVLFLVSGVGIIFSLIVLCGSKEGENEPLIATKDDETKYGDYNQSVESSTENKVRNVDGDICPTSGLSVNTLSPTDSTNKQIMENTDRTRY